MELRVENIASFEFRNEYFANQGHDWKASWPKSYPKEEIPLIIPTRKTEQKLNDLGLYMRSSERGFNLLSQVKKEGSTFLTERKTNTNHVLCFFLSAPNPFWNQYTKGGEKGSGLAIYSNLTGYKSAGADGTLYLHDELPSSAADTKEPGALVRKGNHVYEALKRTDTQAPGANWEDLGLHTNYTTLEQKVPVNRGTLVVEANTLAGAAITIKDIYDTVVWSYTFDAGSTEKRRSFDIADLEEGIYHWQLNTIEQDTFLICENEPTGCFGLVMLYLQPNQTEIPGSQQLSEEWLPIANGGGSLSAFEINPRNYVVHFLANRAKWKYIFSRDLAIPSEDVPASYAKLGDVIYQSKKPIPITKLESGPDFGLDQRLPAATAGILLPQYNGGNTVESYVKEIYVNV